MKTMADKIYENRIAARTVEEGEYYDSSVSYTHLTLPTIGG